MGTFRALVLEMADGKVTPAVRSVSTESLPAGDVVIDVAYSTINYKDGLILKGRDGMRRAYPHVGGIDLSGTVSSSSDPRYKAGDKVVVTGWQLGEIQWGGYAEKARVKAGWPVPLPKELSLKDAMAIGTAGFTAMECVLALERHGLKPDAGEVLVTGAAGGVGSVAVAILAKLGYTVVASSGRPELAGYLRDLGAATIIDRAELAKEPDKPMLATRWAGAVDTVGSTTLATAIAQMKPNASIAACGLAGGPKLPTTVLPFILRGVNLLGINSVLVPFEDRREIWRRLASDLPLAKLNAMTETVGLAKVPEFGEKILAGQVRGRLVVDVKA